MSTLCVYVCLSLSIHKDTYGTICMILCMLPTAVAQSSSFVFAIRYVVPALWMTAVQPILMQFGTMMHFEPLDHPDRQKFEILQIQDGGGCHLENLKIVISQPRFERFRRNLAWWCSLTLLTVPTVKNLKFQKSKMAAAAIMKNRKIAISQLRFERFRRNLAWWRSSALVTVWPVTEI